MKKDEILKLIQKYFHEEFEVPMEKIVPDAKLFEDLNLDSIDALDMVGMLESELDIEIDESGLSRIRTVKDVINFVEKQAG